MAVYVHDLIGATYDESMLQEVKNELNARFRMKDLGRLEYCLGIEFKESEDDSRVAMSQKRYCDEVVRRFNLELTKTAITPWRRR